MQMFGCVTFFWATGQLGLGVLTAVLPLHPLASLWHGPDARAALQLVFQAGRDPCETAWLAERPSC